MTDYTSKELALVMVCMAHTAMISISSFYLSVFALDQPDFTCVGSNQTNVCFDKCTDYEFDQSTMTNSLISEWSLVCDSSWMAALPNYGFAIGQILSTFFVQLSDVIGRWKVWMLSLGGIVRV